MKKLKNFGGEINKFILEKYKHLKGKYLFFGVKEGMEVEVYWLNGKSVFYFYYCEDVFIKERTGRINIKLRRINKNLDFEKYPYNFSIENLDFENYDIFILDNKEEIKNVLVLEEL